MLYDPAAFEPLTNEPWDEARARDGIAAIVADADAAFDPDALWPAHEWDGWNAALPMKNLYVGAAGVVWALDELRRRGLAETALDLPAIAIEAVERWRAEPDYVAGEALPEPPESGLLTGEVGILFVACKLGLPFEDDLRDRIRANLANEAEDLMWGTPGTLVAATAMGWDDLARESADALASRRDADGLWTQQLWGTSFRGIGTVHGLAGNVLSLLQVDDARNEALRTESAEALSRAAKRVDGLANWGSEGKLQWCASGPGIVSLARDYLDEELLLAGAELVWQAGAPGDEKGHGICHGTSGNGFALLAAFERTQDELWLDRARRFALHALAQAQRRPGRYSLFTGGAGTALFAAACLDGDARYPVLEGNRRAD
ncbi:MAG TPA: lanthionine synthetase LanC family protein [Gaiellaceae bacterium]|nr:lanthionine synthetase LanC family protein [Gaiellaceae bacterium]